MWRLKQREIYCEDCATTTPIEPYSFQELIEETRDCLSGSAQQAFISAQRVDLEMKVYMLLFHSFFYTKLMML